MCRVQVQVMAGKIQLWDCHSGANQVWLRGAGNSLRPAHAPNKAMDIKDAWWGALMAKMLTYGMVKIAGVKAGLGK
jgi:hypothetical protein